MHPEIQQIEYLSGTDRRRQIEESVAQAMLRYRQDFENIRANTERLRALREAAEIEVSRTKPRTSTSRATPSRAGKKSAKTG